MLRGFSCLRSSGLIRPKFLSTCPMASSETPQPDSTVKHQSQQAPKQQQQQVDPKPFSSMPRISAFRMLIEALTGKIDVRKPLQSWLRNKQELGDIYTMNLGKPVVFVTDVAEYEKILRAAVVKYPPPLNIPPLKKYVVDKAKSDSNFVPFYHLSEGELWRKNRTILDEKLLHPSEVEQYMPELSSIAGEMVAIFNKRLNDKQQVEGLDELLYAFSVEGIGYVVFGYRMGGLANKPEESVKGMLKDLRTVMQTSSELSMTFPFYNLFQTPTYKKMIQAVEKPWGPVFAQKADDYFAQHPEIQRHDLLFHQRQRGLNEQECIQNALIQFQAGSDSTTHSVNWLIHNLGRYPDVQQKLRKDVNDAKEKGVPLTPEALSKMRYLKAVVKESLRLTPVVSGLPRTLTHSITVKGYEIPAGTDMLLMQMVSNQDPAVYADPETFLPERWLPQAGAPRPNAFHTMPFGFGPRMCQGFRIAEMEMYCLMSHLVQHFRWEHIGPRAEPLFEIFHRPEKPLDVKWHPL